MTFDLDKLVRENIRELQPYSSARGEFSGRGRIFLDANENSFGSPLPRNYHRYPDPLQNAIREKVARLNRVEPGEIFIGNGSDEAIDLLFRIFCRPGTADNVLICPPTYGMYQVSAGINDVGIKRARLTDDFRLDPQLIEKTADEQTKLLFICSPNNPTGNAFPRAEISAIAANFAGIVIVDEAYIHFSREGSMVDMIGKQPNLVVLQTFSKAWGLAGLRVGLAFADQRIIGLFNKVKPPYNVSGIAQEAVLEALENHAAAADLIARILAARTELIEHLTKLSLIEKIYPTDANFVLVKTADPAAVYKYLLNKEIVIRDRSRVELCAGCLRITVGTPEENAELLRALQEFGDG